MEKREALICALTPRMSEPRPATAIPGALRAPGCLDWDWGEGRQWTGCPLFQSAGSYSLACLLDW